MTPFRIREECGPERIEDEAGPRYKQRHNPAASATPAVQRPGEERIRAPRTDSATDRRSRDIDCLKCGHLHTVPPDSTSALCPRCGDYTSLRNYEIHETWERNIRTRGDVFVHKNALVEFIKVQCYNLVVEGSFTGAVECGGDFIIRNHGKINGRVKCKRLIVERRAEVEFANAVHAEEVIIDGLVQGQIVCNGSITLEAKAHLRGDIQARSLIVNTGARHCGMVRVPTKGA